jgi:tRNA nucleotidyltransferase (CCA-adding enzyme)
MQIYEVGGAVRDALLGETVNERDFVVVGATADDLLARGFRRVGTDFPVFLHPQTGEEYALARTERKTGPGYTGFAFDTAATVTLEEDLLRRDLTVNAIARDDEGRLIDPYGGLADLQARRLRHVSPAFAEDPLRVLRVARFVAQLSRFGFEVAEETRALMREIVRSGEIAALRPERIWLETRKALLTPRPDLYFAELRACDALALVFPEIERLFGVPQPAKWHPEIDTGLHTLMALRVAAELSDRLAVRFAVLTHDLGKGTTPREIWPRHTGHGVRSVTHIRELCARIPVPTKLQGTAEIVAAHHGTVHSAERLSAAAMHELLLVCDAFRQPERLDDVLLACEADARGRLGLEHSAYPQANLIKSAFAAAREIGLEDLPDAHALQGAEIGAALRLRRQESIASVLDRRQPPP